MLPGYTTYNMPQIAPFYFLKDRDLERLEENLRKLVHSHESLRTSFELIAGEPVQRVHHEVEFPIEYFDFAQEADAVKNDAVKNFIRPFDLSRTPLFRVGLIKEQENRHFLVVDMHHIISDGVSNEILIRDFYALYEGRQLQELRIQYKDFAQWLHRPEVKEAVTQQEDYWLNEFRAEIPLLNLPIDYPRPMVQSFEGSFLDFEISPEHTRLLESIASTGGATLYMVLLAVMNILFSKLSGQEDIIIGSPVAGRRHADLEKIIGMFVNTLALWNYPKGEKTFNQFLKEVKENTLKAFENQEYPFEDLVEKIDVDRDASRNPLFDVMFALQTFVGQDLPAPDQVQDPFENNTAKFDLTVVAVKAEGEKLLVSLQYCTKLFKKETIEGFITYLKRIISSVTAEPGMTLGQIEIISGEEKRKLLHDFNDTGETYPRERTLHQLFQHQAGKTPDSISLACDREGNREMVTLTYRELNGRADRLARLLIEKGVKENHLVGLLADRSVEMIIGMLGISKAGGAYIPLNPKAPASRNGYLLKESSAEILLTTRSLFEEEKKVSGWQGEIIFFEDRENVDSFPAPCSLLHASPGHLAYVIFTSGSTGTPKGVPITHANLSPLLHWGYRQLGLGPPDRVLQNLSYYFDWSAWEIFITITTGAGLIITSEEVLLNPQLCAAFMDKQNITALHVTPSQYQYLAQTDRPLETLQYLFIGAEKLTLDLARRSFQLVKEGCRVFNMYGPTECTIITSVLELDADALDDYQHLTSVPIGPPAANVDYLVLDKYLKPCPTMINGELYIAGDGLAPGYISDPEKTRSAFVPNIYEGEGITGSRLYKTGDIARWLPDGTVEYLGRIDHQVKIRGYRIELGEIESQLLKHQNVRDAVVLVNEDAGHDKYICAYLVPGRTLSTMELKQYLAQQLPDYMIPSYFVQIEKIPLNPNGKLDRKALPIPDLKAEGVYKPPGNEIETKLVEIWAEVLGIEKDIIGIDANFFQLGGHSLKATVVLAKIHKELEVKIPLVEIFTNPTVQELAECIKGLTEEQYKAIEPVEKKDYYAVSSSQRRLYVLQQMEAETTVYNMPLVIPLGEEADTKKLETTFIRLIERHESFRTSFLLVNQEPAQRIHDRADFKIERPEGREVKSLISNFVRAFDLSRVPLVRAGLLQTGDSTPLLVVDMHHIVSDGVSFDILVQDFTHLYPGGDLPPLRIQYKDFAEWQTLQSQRESMNQLPTCTREGIYHLYSSNIKILQNGKPFNRKEKP
jgi:amino acid adenylation domain-containing protein